MNLRKTSIIIQNHVFEYYFKRVLAELIEKDFNLNGYRYFLDEQGIDDWALEHNEYFRQKKTYKNNLKATEDELKVLESFNFYSGYVGERMNNLLRGNKNYIDGEYLIEHIERIERTLFKFSLKENLIAIRRLPCKYIDSNFKKGTIFLDKGFMSTTLNLSYRLNNEGELSPLYDEALMIIKIPKGTNSLYIKEISGRDEYELLLPKNTKILIERNKKIFKNRIVVASVMPVNL